MSDYNSTLEADADQSVEGLAQEYGGATMPEAFDFSRTDRMSKENRKALLAVHERFARNLTVNISSALGTAITFSVQAIDQCSFRQFSGSITSPTCCLGMRFHPSSQRGLLELNLEIALPVIEILLGGTPKPTVEPPRELTEIELHLLESLFATVVEDYGAAWQGMAEIECTVETVTKDPESCGVLRSHESVAVVQFEVSVGEISGRMNAVIPTAFLRSVRQDFDSEKPIVNIESTTATRNAILRRIEPSILEVEAQLAGLSISMQDALALAPGDLIAFDQGPGSPITLTIGGRKKYLGKITAVNGKRRFAAMAHTSRLDPSDR